MPVLFYPATVDYALAKLVLAAGFVGAGLLLVWLAWKLRKAGVR